MSDTPTPKPLDAETGSLRAVRDTTRGVWKWVVEDRSGRLVRQNKSHRCTHAPVRRWKTKNAAERWIAANNKVSHDAQP